MADLPAAYTQGPNSRNLYVFRREYADLDRVIDLYKEWLMHPQGCGLRLSTAHAYTSFVRSTYVRMLTGDMPPSLAFRSINSTSGTMAWRSFLAMVNRGGYHEVMQADGRPKLARFTGLDQYLPPVTPMVAELTRTPLGDVLDICGLMRPIAYLWLTATPQAVRGLTAAHVFATHGEGLVKLAPRILLHANSLEARAAVLLALWGHAGSPTVDLTRPFLPGWPTTDGMPASRAPMAAYGLWDVAARCPPLDMTVDPKAAIPLPTEGEALLAGEAIDLSGVESLLAQGVTAQLLRKLNSARWSGSRRLTGDEEVEEFIRYWTVLGNPQAATPQALDAAYPLGVEAAKRLQAAGKVGFRVGPPQHFVWGAHSVETTSRWIMQANVAGVAALGEGVGDHEGLLTEREAETPPPAEPTEAFDAPELPSA